MQLWRRRWSVFSCRQCRHGRCPNRYFKSETIHEETKCPRHRPRRKRQLESKYKGHPTYRRPILRRPRSSRDQAQPSLPSPRYKTSQQRYRPSVQTKGKGKDRNYLSFKSCQLPTLKESSKCDHLISRQRSKGGHLL